MGKKSLLYVICLSLLLSTTGCAGSQADAPAVELPAADLAAAVAAGTEEPADAELLDSGRPEDLAFYLENIYGLESGTWEDAAVRRGAGVQAYEIAVVRFTSANEAQEGQARLTEYIEGRAGDFAGYAPDQAALAENAALVCRGPYLGLFICPEPEAAGEVFRTALETGELPAPASAPPVSPSPAPARTEPAPEATAEPHEIIFPEVTWIRPRGEPDPQYPDRIRYEDPGDEDMSLYDTGPILRAWESGDPSGLSAADREIYEAARTLLDDIFTEGMDELQREKAVYTWMVHNINYDWTHTDVTQATSRESYGPYGGLVAHTAVCLGFASTFQLLMDMADVECITVIGASQGSTESHAWNMVRLHDQWYCVDATWDSNYRENGSTDGWTWYFFNVPSDTLAASNHQWDYAAVPEATATDHGMG